ncbi:hypothetical protein FOZ63_022668, partial [Perkinsus olseni]
NNSYVEFTVLADEAASESSDNPQIEGLLKAMDTGEDNPTSSVVSEMLEKLNGGELGMSANGSLASQLSIHYTIYLSKANINQPFKLGALKAELATNSKQCE